jgi:hypothetical protein
MADDDDGDWITFDAVGGAPPAPPPLPAPAPAVTPRVIPAPAPAPAAKPDDDWVTFEAVTPQAAAPMSAYEAAGGRATWGDVGHAAMAGVHGLAASAAGAYESLPGTQGQRGFATSEQQAAQDEEAAMTPYSRAPGFFKHPLVSAAEAAPAMAALGGAGALGSAVGGPGIGAAAGAAAFGAMNVGDVANRLRVQGIDPTPEALAGAFAMGAAAGVVPELGLAGKIATGAIAKRVLSGGENAIIFGAAGAGQEALGQEQEIKAGKRAGYDPSAILGAGEEQAEFGAGMGLLHGRGTGGEERAPGAKAIEQHQDQTGGAFSVTRGGKGDSRKPEALAGAAPDVAEKSGPAPPASPVADPDIALGAKGEAVTPESKAPGTAPGGPPAAAAEAPATPVAATKTPVPEAPRGSPDEALQQQHAEMMDPKHPREAVLYPPGIEPMPITERKSRYGSTPLPDGSTLQYDRSGPSRITKAKLNDAIDAGRHDEYVQGVTKEPEVKPAAAATTPPSPETPETPIAAPPAAIQGAPATTLPADLERPPAASLEASRGQQPPVAEIPAEVAEPRVLPAAPATEHERTIIGEAAREQAARVQENLKALTTEKAEAGGKHWTKRELSDLEGNNKAAKEIVDKHPPPKATRNLSEVKERAAAMVQEARKAGIRFPNEFGEGTKHGPGTMLLSEARDLVAKKKPSLEDYTRFLDREGMLRKEGGMGEAVAVRRAEGAEAAALGAPEGATEVGRAGAEHEVSPEEEMLRREEEEEQAKQEARQAKEEKQEPKQGEMRVGAADEAKEKAPAYAAFGTRTAPVITLKRRGGVKKQEMEGRPGALVKGAEGEPIEVGLVHSGTVHDVMPDNFKPGDYSPELRPAMQRLADKVGKITWNVPVHFISHEDMLRTFGEAHGLYDPDAGHILMNADDPGRNTLLHEAFHAATTIALKKDPELMRALTDLHQEVMSSKEMQNITPEWKEVLSDPEEFLTRLMTDDMVQSKVKGIKISRELADQLQVPKWRKATMWEGVLSLIRRALGLGPRDTSAIEAAMAVTEFTLHKNLPAEAMGFAARWRSASWTRYRGARTRSRLAGVMLIWASGWAARHWTPCPRARRSL